MSQDEHPPEETPRPFKLAVPPGSIAVTCRNCGLGRLWNGSLFAAGARLDLHGWQMGLKVQPGPNGEIGFGAVWRCPSCGLWTE